MERLFVDKDVIVIRPDVIAEWMSQNAGGYRAAAKHFESSASTLCRFMRRNGYRSVTRILSPRVRKLPTRQPGKGVQ